MDKRWACQGKDVIGNMFGTKHQIENVKMCYNFGYKVRTYVCAYVTARTNNI